MKLEQQVCSLELAKRLRDLGVKQDGAFFWVEPCGGGEWILRDDESFDHMASLAADDYVSAFTVAELERLLPFEVNFPFKNGKKRSHNHWRVIGKQRPNGYAARYVGGNSLTNIEVQAETFADSLAQMLIYLLENKLITLQ